MYDLTVYDELFSFPIFRFQRDCFNGPNFTESGPGHAAERSRPCILGTQKWLIIMLVFIIYHTAV